MDTTVILAQPRVSRLRAAAVYVDHRGCPGAADIGVIHSGLSRGPPPNPWFSTGQTCAKIPLSVREIWPPEAPPGSLALIEE